MFALLLNDSFFCLPHLYRDCPSHSSTTETLSGLLQIKHKTFVSLQNLVYRPAMFTVPCWCLPPPHASICCPFTLLLYSQYARACVCVCVLVRARVYVCVCVNACVSACVSACVRA